ncbi:MAG: integrase core domain-containing protein [Thermoleophilia bacterium]
MRPNVGAPYAPEQNGMIERFFRSLKEECVWQDSFQDFAEALRAILDRICWYNDERPHRSLSHLSPAEYRAQQLQLAA